MDLLLGSNNIFEVKYSEFVDLLVEKSNIKYKVDDEYEDEDNEAYNEEDDYVIEDKKIEEATSSKENDNIVIDINTYF